MKLLVGLGNPGRKYQGTRHNVGFAVLERLRDQHGQGTTKADFQGEIAQANLKGARTLLLWPHTFMNLSGASVLAARDFYKLDNQDLLIVCDDFNLPLGKLRVRASGTAGGQKGLENIIHRLGTQQIPRLRIGIDAPPPTFDAADFVLSKFRKEELPTIEEALERACDAVLVWAEQGIDECMTRFNG